MNEHKPPTVRTPYIRGTCRHAQYQPPNDSTGSQTGGKQLGETFRTTHVLLNIA